MWATIFGLLYFSNYLATRYADKASARPSANWLALSYFFSLLPFVPVLVWFIEYLVSSIIWKRILFLGFALAPTVYAYTILFEMGLAEPGIHIYPPHTEWNDVQFWARDHTAKEAVFIAPPHIWWLFTSDWRVFSERSTVVTLSELLEIMFAPNYTNTWRHRIDELAPGAVAQFRGNPLENERIISHAFYSLSDEQLLEVACEYHAEFLVVEKPHSYGFNVTYENAGFSVYGLPLKSCPIAGAVAAP
jgi:hypothetical protein